MWDMRINQINYNFYFNFFSKICLVSFVLFSTSTEAYQRRLGRWKNIRIYSIYRKLDPNSDATPSLEVSIYL